MGKKKDLARQTAVAARDAALAARDAADAARSAVQFAEDALTQIILHDSEEEAHAYDTPMLDQPGTGSVITVKDAQTMPAITQTNSPANLPPPEANQAPHVAPKPKGGLRRVGMFVIIIGALGIIGWKGFDYLTTGRYLISTDDAYIKAQSTIIAPKIPGYIAALNVNENQFVHKDQVIAHIDDGDYQLALRDAIDRIAGQDATLARIDKQKTAQLSMIAEAEAQLPAAKQQEITSKADLDRTQILETQGYTTRKILEQAEADYQRAVAGVKTAEATIATANANLGVLDGQRLEALRTKDQLLTAKAKAERDLSFTDIKAPFDGIVGNKTVHLGDFVQPGLQLMVLVPKDSIYIEANFKETQLANMKIGQSVEIHVDALGARKIEGVVQSFAPASGSEFSLLPPDNATGNFTKIVQRIPVHIALPDDIIKEGLLRAGLSVVAEVNTKPQDDKDKTASAPPPQSAVAEEAIARGKP